MTLSQTECTCFGEGNHEDVILSDMKRLQILHGRFKYITREANPFILVGVMKFYVNGIHLGLLEQGNLFDVNDNCFFCCFLPEVPCLICYDPQGRSNRSFCLLGECVLTHMPLVESLKQRTVEWYLLSIESNLVTASLSWDLESMKALAVGWTVTFEPTKCKAVMIERGIYLHITHSFCLTPSLCLMSKHTPWTEASCTRQSELGTASLKL